MKIKTANLADLGLCYTVCMIELPHLIWGKTIGLHHASNQVVVPELKEPKCYSPYMGWGMLGPIIEREKISIRQWEDEVHAYMPGGEWSRGSGPTPLIAAMRCYVASKLGDEVEIPEELTCSPNT